MMQAIMIDFETLSLAENAVIVSIGAVKFDPHSPNDFHTLLREGIRINLKIQPQIDSGREISASTLKFWLAQDKTAIDVNFNRGEEVGIDTAIRMLQGYIEMEDVEIYHRGDRDAAWLHSMERQTGELLSKYHMRRDTRTIFAHRGWEELRGEAFLDLEIKRPSMFIAHDPLHDAAMEAYLLTNIV